MNGKRKWTSVILPFISLLVVIYFLGYSGKPISDDEQLYANAARNVGVLGRLSAEQIYGNLRLKGDYHGVEPAHPALASLWLRLFHGNDVGSVQLLFLLPVIYSVFTGILMLVLSKRLGYSIQTGLVIVLFYNFSTMAWPYAKTFFRESLGGMLMLGSWYFYITAHQEKDWKQIISILLFIISGVVLVLTKVVYGSLWIAFFIIWYFNDKEKNCKKVMLRSVLVVFMFLCLWLVYSGKFTDDNLFYRISGGFIYDAFERIFSISHAHFWDTMLEPLFSPFKGLFIYSPVLVLSFFSLILNWRKSLQLFTLPLTILFALLLVQSLSYDSEWWTPTWGSRFLLPAIPLLLIMSLPLMDDLLYTFRWGRLALTVIFILGFFLQLPAVLFNSSSFFARMHDYRSIDSSKIFWDFSRSPLLLQWHMFDNLEFDLLIWRVFPYQPIFVISFVVMAVLFAIISLRWLYFDFLDSVVSARILQIRGLFSSVFIILLVCGVLFLGRYDPFYRAQDFKPLCDLLHAKIRPGDVVVIYSYPGDLWNYFSNAECGQSVWYSLPYGYYEDPNSEKYQMGVELFSIITADKYLRLWFITQYDASPLSDFEKTEFEDDSFYLLDDGYANTSIPVYYSLYELR